MCGHHSVYLVSLRCVGNAAVDGGPTNHLGKSSRARRSRRCQTSWAVEAVTFEFHRRRGAASMAEAPLSARGLKPLLEHERLYMPASKPLT